MKNENGQEHERVWSFADTGFATGLRVCRLSGCQMGFVCLPANVSHHTLNDFPAQHGFRLRFCAKLDSVRLPLLQRQ